MRPAQSPAPAPRRRLDDAGGAVTGFLVAILVLAAVAVGAFFYFGGEADVDVKNPDVEVSSDETPD